MAQSFLARFGTVRSCRPVCPADSTTSISIVLAARSAGPAAAPDRQALLSSRGVVVLVTASQLIIVAVDLNTYLGTGGAVATFCFGMCCDVVESANAALSRASGNSKICSPVRSSTAPKGAV